MSNSENLDHSNDQEEVSNWIAEKLSSREWAVFELPGLMAKFGLMTPAEFKNHIKNDILKKIIPNICAA